MDLYIVYHLYSPLNSCSKIEDKRHRKNNYQFRFCNSKIYHNRENDIADEPSNKMKVDDKKKERRK